MNDFGIKAGVKDADLTNEELQKLWDETIRYLSQEEVDGIVSGLVPANSIKYRRVKELSAEFKRRLVA